MVIFHGTICKQSPYKNPRILIASGCLDLEIFMAYERIPNKYLSGTTTHTIHGTGIFTYIWLIFMVNVGKYTIHGWYGQRKNLFTQQKNIPSRELTYVTLGKGTSSTKVVKHYG